MSARQKAVNATRCVAGPLARGVVRFKVGQLVTGTFCLPATLNGVTAPPSYAGGVMQAKARRFGATDA